MQKLTLNVDSRVVTRAKRYAASRGTSLSKVVQTLLDVATAAGSDEASPPILGRLRGSMKQGSRDDYRRYLVRKHL